MENGEKHDPIDSDKDQFKEVLAYIETTDLEYVEIERNGKKICLKRSHSAFPEKSSASDQQVDSGSEKDKGPDLFIIRSPIVGRFHSSMGADRPALVVEGGHLTAGQRVAIVEAMKIKKEVFSAVTGLVKKIHVSDGDAVEYGQELFSVLADEPGSEE